MTETNNTGDWKAQLKMKRDRNDNEIPINNISNLVLILENDEQLKGKIRYNEFTLKIEHDDLPWGAKGDWEDGDTSQLAYLLESYRCSGFNNEKIANALLVVAQQHRCHPIREYLDSLVWDGIPRIESLFIDYFHTEDIPLYRNAAICFFAKAVQRIYDPGCDLQFMLEFLGPQGTGKSAFGKALVGDKWFNDSDIDVGSKDGYMALANSWIIEIAEGDSFNKKEASSVKKFISSTSDTYRPPYGRCNVKIPRQCIFIGTTNEDIFLNDQTGNRRFWPIETRATADDAVERIKWLRSIADQLWAEAVVIYVEREKWVDELVLETTRGMAQLQLEHNQIDPLLDELNEFLDTKLPSIWSCMSTDEKRYFYSYGEKEREEFYRTRLISHDQDQLRMRVSAYEFVSEFLGISKSSPKYVPTCKHAHRLLASMPGWKRDPEEHRYEGRGRVFYKRIVNVQANEEQQPDTCKRNILTQSQLEFPDPNMPFPVNSGGEDLPF